MRARERRRREGPRRARRLSRLGLGLGLGALLVVVIAGRLPGVVEVVYARGLYPPLARGGAAVSGVLPFSLAEVVFVALALAVPLALVGGMVRARRRGRGRLRSFGSGALRALGLAGWIWTLFLLAWGLNYWRVSPPALFRLPPPPELAQRDAIVERIGLRLDALREGLPEDEQGVVQMPPLAQLEPEIARLQAEVLGEAGLPVITAGRTKSFAASPLLLRWGVSGVYGPFTFEPNIVQPAVPAMLPVVVAHERAHLSGLAWEEAASFVALLTVWRSSRPEVRYAGWLDLWLHLRGVGAERSPGVQRDLAAIARFIREHRGAEAPALWKAYSGYLRAHGVRGGTASYGRVAGMALAWLERYGWPPEPREFDPPGPLPE
jgi:hypothetical protein